MILTIDVGNTQIYGGLFNEDKIILQFRKSSRASFSSDEIGIFLRQILRENEIDYKNINGIAICSVVPDLVYSLRNGCIKYFSGEPFLLKPGVRSGLKIKYKNPLEVGADRIANSVAGYLLFPNKNLIIIDFGTATTIDVVSENKEYLGGAIVPGLRISMEALEAKTARLPLVEIEKPESVVGKTTKESIQSGLYYGHIGTIKEIIQRIKREVFNTSEPVILATGGFSHMFRDEELFDELIPDLVLMGIYFTYKMNYKDK